MSETAGAPASLDAKQISERAAATRDLARNGGFEDAERMIAMATADKSPSVRLYAAAAAVAILMRGRGAYGRTPWTPTQRASVLSWVGSSDPARTPSLLLCYAAFPETDIIKRLTRMLKDPRNGVRAGAAAALRRMALSGAAASEGTELREWVGEALDNRKLPMDAVTELVRLVGEAGWEVLLPRARVFRHAIPDIVAEAEDRCTSRSRPEAWTGVWVDEGRDVLEETPPVRADWFVLGAATEPADGQLTHGGRRFRRIWAPRPATEGSHAAIQADGRTWWRQEGKDLAAFVIDADRDLAGLAEQAPILARFLESAEGATGMRSRALLWARCGKPELALEILESPLSAKKPRNDLHFVHALALRGLGRHAEARAALQTYLEKAKKSEPWREEAETLLAAL